MKVQKISDKKLEEVSGGMKVLGEDKEETQGMPPSVALIADEISFLRRKGYQVLVGNQVGEGYSKCVVLESEKDDQGYLMFDTIDQKLKDMLGYEGIIPMR